MKKALYQLAEENNLPPVQHMDRETFDWVVANRPVLPDCKLPIKEEIREIVKKFIPDREWFLTSELYDSIHGIRHIGRVIANATNLTINRRIDERTIQNLMVACAIHDLRRIDDKGDIGHGERATTWLKENQVEVEKKYGLKMSDEDMLATTLAIQLHEIPYVIIEGLAEYKKNKVLVDLIKTADALDRYRLPKIKWWINEELLSLHPSEEEKSMAFEIFVKCENEYLKSNDSQGSVISGLNKL
jgi:hypothetical protein